MRRNYLWHCFPAFLAFAVLAGCSDDASENEGNKENGEETQCEVAKCEEADCEVSKCGDGKLTSGEICEGDQFAEGVKVCPGDMIEVPDPVYTCTNTCMVDVSKACVSSVCGDGKLTGIEPCEGDLFREDAKVCPDGKTKIEGRDLFSCNLCTIDDSYACYGDGEKAPKLYFSELRVQTENQASEIANHLYIEIGNLGIETPLDDCKLVGLNLDENDNTKLSSTYAFEYPLEGFLGNTASDPYNVLNICYESKEGWLKSQYAGEEATTMAECEAVANYKAIVYYECLAGCEGDKSCIFNYCSEDNSSQYLHECTEKVRYKTIEAACDIVIPASDTNLLLTVTRSTYKSDKFWGLGLVCDDGMHDVFRVFDTPNAYNGWQRWCPKGEDLSSIEATGEKIYSTSEEYWGQSSKDSLASRADAYDSYDYASCASYVIN